MNIDKTFEFILNELEKGHRGLINPTQSETETLNFLLLQQSQLDQVLCIISHYAHPHPGFEKGLLLLLSSPAKDQHKVLALHCARRHIVESRFVRGIRLDYDFLETLKKLIYHPNPEIVEWALRLIEGCGNQGVYFLKEFDTIKPPPWKWFNAHYRAIREIITLLERRWRVHEKTKSSPRDKN